MKKFWYLALIAILTCSITSCGDDDEDLNVEWKTKNENAFDEVVYKGYTRIDSESKNGSIYYKVLRENPNPGKRPFFTAQVKVNYKGSLVNGEVFDYTRGFDTEVTDDDVPVTFWLYNSDENSTLVDGWRTALQQMHEGDKWEVWVPWQLGYGASGNSAIPGYSTLVFQIELLEVLEQEI